MLRKMSPIYSTTAKDFCYLSSACVHGDDIVDIPEDLLEEVLPSFFRNDVRLLQWLVLQLK